MSALDGWIDVCRTGRWRDANGRDVDVTEAKLDGIVEAYGKSDPAPLVVGHPPLDAPAWGWIESVRRTGDRLQAKFRDVAPEFRAAVEAGRYTGRSIALKGDQLRHVGFLGGRAPAVDGLSPTQFGSKADETIVLAETELAADTASAVRMALRSMAGLARGMRDRMIASDGIDAANEALPDWQIENLNRIADDLDDADPATFAKPEPGKDPKPQAQEGNVTDKPTEAELAAQKATNDAKETELAAREASLEAAEKANASAATLAAAERAIEPHVAAGRVLPAEKAGLAALMASLPQDDATIEFAAPEGEGVVQKKPREILDALLAALPARVDYREDLAGGAMPPVASGQSNDSKSIAAEASVLMAEAAKSGVTLSPVDAVDQVRAKRGLK